MMRIEAVVTLFPDLAEAELAEWIARGWLQPEFAEGTWIFAEIDVARAFMIHDLRARMAIAPDDLSLVLGLVDQVYDLRRQLRTVMDVVGRHPVAIREAIEEALGR